MQPFRLTALACSDPGFNEMQKSQNLSFKIGNTVLVLVLLVFQRPVIFHSETSLKAVYYILVIANDRDWSYKRNKASLSFSNNVLKIV